MAVSAHPPPHSSPSLLLGRPLVPLSDIPTRYCSRCRRPVRCMSLALRSLKLHSQSLQRKRITFPSSLHT